MCARSHYVYVLVDLISVDTILRGDSGGIVSCETRFEDIHDRCFVGLSDSPCPSTVLNDFERLLDEIQGFFDEFVKKSFNFVSKPSGLSLIHI